MLEFLKSFAGFLTLAGLVVLGFIAFFVAWWIVVLGVLVAALYLALRALFPRKPKDEGTQGGQRKPKQDVRVIEGEYRVEQEDD